MPSNQEDSLWLCLLMRYMYVRLYNVTNHITWLYYCTRKWPHKSDCSKRFTYETTNLSSTPKRNAANSQTFYSNNYLTYLETFCTMTLAHYIIHICTLLFILCILPSHSFAFHTFFSLHLYIILTRNIFSYPWWCHRSVKARSFKRF